jgi:hypothetical protein
MGPAAEAAAHFEALGHPCPPHYNPAEFYADLISVDPTNPDTEQRTRWAKFRVMLQAGGLHLCDLSCKAGYGCPRPCCCSSKMQALNLLLWMTCRQRIQQLVDAFKQKQAMRQLDDGAALPEDDTALSQSSAAETTPTAGWRRQFRCSVSHRCSPHFDCHRGSPTSVRSCMNAAFQRHHVAAAQ